MNTAGPNSRWRATETSHGFLGRCCWSAFPVGMLAFMGYAGIFHSVFNLFAFGPFLLGPSLWLLIRIWKVDPA